MKHIRFVLLLAALPSFCSVAQANCRNEGPYHIRQCDTRGYFAPPPSGSGKVTGVWWQLGFGNHSTADPTPGIDTGPYNANGFIGTPLPGVFIGNDSGGLTVGSVDSLGMDLIDAEAVGGPPGSRCFGVGASWGLLFADGCADNDTFFLSNDDYLNPYWYTGYGGSPGTYSLYSQLDRPMAFLLTEETGRHFALAFSATKSRNRDESDTSPGQYDLGDLINGDPNPLSTPAGVQNVIPWQAVPQPRIAVGFVDPDDLSSDRVLALSWQPIRLVHDGSVRPNPLATLLVDEDPHRQLLGAETVSVTGVGVLDQPELARYQVQTKPNGAGNCDPLAPWVDYGSPAVHPASTRTLTVAPDTCVRLCTQFGRIPSGVFRTEPTSLSRFENFHDALSAMLGDVGYEVCSRPSVIGGPLFSDRPIVTTAAFGSARTLTVEFETLTEVAVRTFEVIGSDTRGITKLLTDVPCVECATGVGSLYRIQISGKGLRNLRSVRVVAIPSGACSNEFLIDRLYRLPLISGSRPRLDTK